MASRYGSQSDYLKSTIENVRECQDYEIQVTKFQYHMTFSSRGFYVMISRSRGLKVKVTGPKENAFYGQIKVRENSIFHDGRPPVCLGASVRGFESAT